MKPEDSGLDRESKDLELRSMFAALRREDQSSAPGFISGSRALREDLRRRRGARLMSVSIFAAVVIAALIWLRPPLRPGPAHTVAAPGRTPGVPVASIATWMPPTDFLLDTPGRELLQSTPTVGMEPSLESTVLGQAVRNHPKHAPNHAHVSH